MNEKKISIVIPLYNSAPYLPQCLDSLLSQTYRNIEIICVDDGSNDNSLDILNEYVTKDSRIHVYTKENEGKGAASARNMGLDHVTGEYVHVVDSDDFFAPDMIERMLGKALETDADMVFCTARHYDHLNQRSGSVFKRPEFQYTPTKEPFSWKDCPDYIFQVADFVAWNKLFKTSFLKENKLYFEAIAISDDQYPSVMGSVLAERIAVIKEPFINYRVNTGSSQVDSQSKHPEAAYEAVFSVVNRMRELGVYDDLKRSYCNIAILLMRQYFDRMRRIEDVRFLYDKFRNDIFPFLGADDLTAGYFYDHRVGEWYEMIQKYDLDDLLFRSARGYGSDLTTASLRFSAPLDGIKKGSNVAVIGKGIVGRYWYGEIVLSGLCDEVLWVASKDELPEDIRLDQVIEAK